MSYELVANSKNKIYMKKEDYLWALAQIDNLFDKLLL